MNWRVGLNRVTLAKLICVTTLDIFVSLCKAHCLTTHQICNGRQAHGGGAMVHWVFKMSGRMSLSCWWVTHTLKFFLWHCPSSVPLHCRSSDSHYYFLTLTLFLSCTLWFSPILSLSIRLPTWARTHKSIYALIHTLPLPILIFTSNSLVVLSLSLSLSIFFTAAEQCGTVAKATSHSVPSHPPFVHAPSLTHTHAVQPGPARQ